MERPRVLDLPGGAALESRSRFPAHLVMDPYSVSSIRRSGVHSRRILPVVVSVGSTLLALAALVRVDAPSPSVGRVRPLRERFRAGFEQAARGESLREEGIGERDA